MDTKIVENRLIVYDKKTISVLFYKYKLTDDIIKIILDMLYHNYYNFISNNWHRLNTIDCIYYTKNTYNIEILSNVIKRVNSKNKLKILYEILPFSIIKNKIEIFNILKNNLMNKINSSDDYKKNYKKYLKNNYTFYYFLRENYNLAIKYERKDMIKYFKKITNWYISFSNRIKKMSSYHKIA